MKAIIIDDEKPAQLALQLILEEYCPDIEVVALCGNLPEGIKNIRKLQPELVLLDIEMPGHNGLELLEFFNDDEITFSIIFTTAYNEYAVQAFKLSAVDYLLKPINPQHLQDAIERLQKNNSKIENYKLLKANLQLESITKIGVPNGNVLIFVELSSIMFIKGEGSYSQIFTDDKKKYIISKNLKTTENTLSGNENFIRIHKSYIVNLDNVVSFRKSDGGNVILKNGMHLPISADKIALLLEKVHLVTK